MTRLQQARIRRAKFRKTQEILETALDEIIPTLPVSPSMAFDVVLAYALEGLAAQEKVYDLQTVLRRVQYVIADRGIIIS